MVDELKSKLDLVKHFLVITEKNTAPLYNLAEHMGISIIEHDKNIGGRFSIFSHTGLIPISLISNNVEQLFLGLEKSLDNFIADNPGTIFREEALYYRWISPVSYTHLTLPTNREV